MKLDIYLKENREYQKMMKNIFLTNFNIFLKFLKFDFCREKCDLIYKFNTFV